MKENKTSNSSVFKNDFLWYFIGSLVPMGLGFIKTPIFTRHFDKTSYGELGIVSITYVFLGMILFSWINSCLWRYFARYREAGELKVLYSNLLVLFLISCCFLTFFSLGWMLISNTELVKHLILFSFLQLIFNQLFLAYMVVLRLYGRSAFYTFFHGLKAIAGLVLALVMVFQYNANIAALVSSLAVIDFLSVLLLTALNPNRVSIGMHEVNIKVVRQMLTYGGVGLILNLSLLSIAYSDRYIILWYHSLEEVGIYDQVSKIAQLSLLALITVYFNTIQPKLIAKLETDFKTAETNMLAYMYPFLLLGVPVVFYLSMFSKEVAELLLGAAFREAYLIMPFIFTATFLHGFSNFFELRLKFSNRLKRLGSIALLTAGLNIALNLLLVPNYGYEWAARSTLISYVFMLIFLMRSDNYIYRLPRKWKGESIKILGVLVFQWLVYQTIDSLVDLELLLRITMGIIFLSMYFIIFRNSIITLKIPTN